ncbi:MAG: hypothetical protein ACI8TP_002384 [Acidimicrobiales bacterium]|jgi:hypothetical protein
MLLLSSTLVLLLAGSALASIDSPRPMVAQQLDHATWQADELPDVALLLAGVDASDPVVGEALVPMLAQIPGVTSVLAEQSPSDRTAVFISLGDLEGAPAGNRTLDAIDATLEQVVPDVGVSVGGRAIADRDLLDRLNRGTIVAILPVLLLLTVLTAASFGAKFGLATGGTVAMSTLMSGLIGSKMAGSFDGSLGTTALPAVLVALLVSSVMAFRLLDWFKHPTGDDEADLIQRSVRHLLPETLLLLGGLVATAIVLGLAGPGRTPTTMVAVGAFFGSVVTFAVLPAMLVSLPKVPDEDDYRLFKLNLPDGRDFPTAVLAGFAIFLLALGLFAVRVPTSELLDEAALPEGVASRRVSEQLVELGGDPTSAMLATVSAEVAPEQLASWARTVSALPAVGRTETATGRYVDGSLSAPAANGASFDADADRQMIIITPNVTARSQAAQQLVITLSELDGLGEAVELSGASVDAQNSASDARAHLWLLVFCLAIAGGVSVLVLVGDLRLALVTVLLRLLGTGALLGIYSTVAGSVSAIELHVAALVVSVGVGLFEVGFIRRLAESRPTTDDVIAELLAPQPQVDPVSNALRREGKAAMLGLGITALCGLGFMASDLEIARRLGVAVAVGVVIELLIGTWLLRPVVLGRPLTGVNALGTRKSARFSLDSLAFNRSIKGDNMATDTEDTGEGLENENEDDVLDPAWRRIVAGLLRAEFAFQGDPDSAELSTVFLEDTPVFGELAAHNKRLREAGLRVMGKGPKLLRVRAVNVGSPVTLAISVDHPERKLIDRDGRVLGVRRPERRDGMLWLVQDPSGRYRIAEAVDLGTADTETVTTDAVMPQLA